MKLGLYICAPGICLFLGIALSKANHVTDLTSLHCTRVTTCIFVAGRLMILINTAVASIDNPSLVLAHLLPFRGIWVKLKILFNTDGEDSTQMNLFANSAGFSSHILIVPNCLHIKYTCSEERSPFILHRLPRCWVAATFCHGNRPTWTDKQREISFGQFLSVHSMRLFYFSLQPHCFGKRPFTILRQGESSNEFTLFPCIMVGFLRLGVRRYN